MYVNQTFFSLTPGTDTLELETSINYLLHTQASLNKDLINSKSSLSNRHGTLNLGLKEYISDMWNVVDFITNSLYVATIGLRTVAYFDVSRVGIWNFRKWECLPVKTIIGWMFRIKLYL